MAWNPESKTVQHFLTWNEEMLNQPLVIPTYGKEGGKVENYATMLRIILSKIFRNRKKGLKGGNKEIPH